MNAQYRIVANDEEILIIQDVGHDQGCKSVTNDAERVVAELHSNGILEKQKLLYHDSTGQVDEIKHDGKGGFLGGFGWLVNPTEALDKRT